VNLARELGWKELSLGLGLLLLGAIPCFGQLDATLSGSVSDATGATIPGAAPFVNSTLSRRSACTDRYMAGAASRMLLLH
jgi:hypothetical protein